MDLIVLKPHILAKVNLVFVCKPTIYQSIDVILLFYK